MLLVLYSSTRCSQYFGMAPSPAATFTILWHSLAPHGGALDHGNPLTRHTQLYCCLTALSHQSPSESDSEGGGGAVAALADSNSAQWGSTHVRTVQHGWRSPWRGLRAFTRLAEAGWLDSGLGGRNGGVGTPGSAVLWWSRSGECPSLRLCSLVALFPHVRPGDWLQNQMMGASNPPESRQPGAAGPRLSRRPVGRRSGVDPPFARSEWSDPGWCLVGTRARSYRVGGPKDAARSWARMRLYNGWMQQGVGVPREYAS